MRSETSSVKKMKLNDQEKTGIGNSPKEAEYRDIRMEYFDSPRDKEKQGGKHRLMSGSLERKISRMGGSEGRRNIRDVL